MKLTVSEVYSNSNDLENAFLGKFVNGSLGNVLRFESRQNAGFDKSTSDFIALNSESDVLTRWQNNRNLYAFHISALSGEATLAAMAVVDHVSVAILVPSRGILITKHSVTIGLDSRSIIVHNGILGIFAVLVHALPRFQ